MSKEDFYSKFGIDPDEMDYMGAGDFGKAYSINEVARMFNHKTKFISSRRGERFKSTKINKLHGQKINVFKARIDLKNYIKDLYKNINFFWYLYK